MECTKRTDGDKGCNRQADGLLRKKRREEKYLISGKILLFALGSKVDFGLSNKQWESKFSYGKRDAKT